MYLSLSVSFFSLSLCLSLSLSLSLSLCLSFSIGITIPEHGITIQLNESGRETGEAFVELLHEEDVERALDRHKKVIGHR